MASQITFFLQVFRLKFCVHCSRACHMSRRTSYGAVPSAVFSSLLFLTVIDPHTVLSTRLLNISHVCYFFPSALFFIFFSPFYVSVSFHDLSYGLFYLLSFIFLFFVSSFCSCVTYIRANIKRAKVFGCLAFH
jgi:hypothetical protein